MKKWFENYEVEFFCSAMIWLSGFGGPLLLPEFRQYTLLGEMPYANILRIILTAFIEIVMLQVCSRRKAGWARGTLCFFLVVACPVTITAILLQRGERDMRPFPLVLLYLLLDAAILYHASVRLDSRTGMGTSNPKSPLRILFEKYEVEFFLVFLIYFCEGIRGMKITRIKEGTLGYGFVSLLSLFFVYRVVLCRSLGAAKAAFLMLLYPGWGVGKPPMVFMTHLAGFLLLPWSVIYRTCLDLKAVRSSSDPEILGS